MISVADETLVRRAVEGLGGGVVTGAELRIVLNAMSTKRLGVTGTDRLLTRAQRAGLLFVAGPWMRERCQLDAGWTRPERTAPRRPTAGERRLLAQRLRLQQRLPQSSAPTVPTLGTVCGPPDDEVMPPAVAALVDDLHRRNYEHGLAEVQ